MKNWRRLFVFLLVFWPAAGAAAGYTDLMLKKYLEFYFPSSGRFIYEIAFDWSTYVITTHRKLDEQPHPDSRKYRGYVTMRPSLPEAEGKPLLHYLATPKGEVWVIRDDAGIVKSRQRREEVKSGSMTATTIITSVSEPLIEHFLAQPSKWKKFGRLKINPDGKSSSFIAAAP